MAQGPTPTLKPVDLADIPAIQREGKASRLVSEFLESGAAAAQVEDHSKTFAISLKNYLSKQGAPSNVEVVTRASGTEIYLRRTDGSTPAEAEESPFVE